MEKKYFRTIWEVGQTFNPGMVTEIPETVLNNNLSLKTNYSDKLYFLSETSGIWRISLPALLLPYLEYSVSIQILF